MVQPDGFFAQLLNHAGGVRYTEEAAAGVAELVNLLKAFFLEGGIAHGQNLVDQQDVGIHVDGHREGQAHDHAGRISAERLVDEFMADAGEFDDLVKELAGALAGSSPAARR